MYPQKEFDEDAEDRMINEKIRVRESFQSTDHNKYKGRGVETLLSSLMLRHAFPQSTVDSNPFRVILNVLNVNISDSIVF